MDPMKYLTAFDYGNVTHARGRNVAEANTWSWRRTRSSRSPKGSNIRPGSTTVSCRARRCARPSATGSSSILRIGEANRTRCTFTAFTRRTWTECSRSCRRARRSPTTFIAEPFGVFPYHCHMMPLRKHISRGLLRNADRRSESAASAGDRDDHGHARAGCEPRHGERVLRGQRYRQLLRRASRRNQSRREGAHLSLEHDGVRPGEQLSPAREHVRLLPERHRRYSRRSSRTPSTSARVSAASWSSATNIRACTCFMPTRRSSPSWAGWAFST